MKVATVLDNSLPISIVRKHSGIISVVSKKLMTSVSSTWNIEHSTKPAHFDLQGRS